MATLSYLDKVFRPPNYIWDKGDAQTQLIESTIEGDQTQRLQWLASGSSQPEQAEPARNPPDKEPSIPNAPRTEPTASIPPVDPISGPSKPGATRNAVVPLLSLVWNGNEPQNYFRIGTDPVPFLLDLDTGSSLLWVQARLDDNDVIIKDQSQYNPKSSRTAKDVQKDLTVHYGDGDEVKAVMYSDNVLIQKLLATDQHVGAVSSINLSVKARDGKSNGLIGLGFAGDDTGLVQTLQQGGAIRYPSITLVGPRNDPSQAADIDEQGTMEPRGYLIIGSVDEKYYTGQIAWCPLIANINTAVANRWVVKLDFVILNGTKVFQDQNALIDTGTTYILTSPSNFLKFRKAVGKGARPTRDYMFEYLEDSIKTVSFVLGGRQIDLHPADISLGKQKADAEGVKRCLSSVCTLPDSKWLFPDNFWVLGGIFIDNVVTIFDYSKNDQKVGFADICERDLGANVAAEDN